MSSGVELTSTAAAAADADAVCSIQTSMSAPCWAVVRTFH